MLEPRYVKCEITDRGAWDAAHVLTHDVGLPQVDSQAKLSRRHVGKQQCDRGQMTINELFILFNEIFKEKQYLQKGYNFCFPFSQEHTAN